MAHLHHSSVLQILTLLRDSCLMNILTKQIIFNKKEKKEELIAGKCKSLDTKQQRFAEMNL